MINVSVHGYGILYHADGIEDRTEGGLADSCHRPSGVETCQHYAQC